MIKSKRKQKECRHKDAQILHASRGCKSCEKFVIEAFSPPQKSIKIEEIKPYKRKKGEDGYAVLYMKSMPPKLIDKLNEIIRYINKV